jgi:hypothetical protein
MKQLLLLLLLIIIATNSSAEKTIPGLYLKQSAGGSYNPLGVLITTHLFYRLPLVKKDGILWESSKIDIGIHNDLSPAFENPGLFIQIEPIAIFDCKFQFDLVHLYKHLGFGYIALDSSSSNYHPDSIKDRPQSSNNGYWFKVAPTLKLMIKKLIIANTFSFNSITMDKNGYYLERLTNTRLDNDDILLTNDIFTLYEFSKSFLAGVNFYSNRVQTTDAVTHRLSLSAIYTHRFNPKTDFNGVILAGTYFKHDYLTWKDPYIVFQLEITHKFR